MRSLNHYQRLAADVLQRPLVPHMLTQNGPMARFVEDLGFILPIICGPDWQDPAIIPMPLGTRQRSSSSSYGPPCAPIMGSYRPQPPDGTRCVRQHRRLLTLACRARGVPACPRQVHALSAALAAADGRAWVQRLLANAGTTEVHPCLAANLSQSQGMSVAAFTELLEDIDQFRSEMLASMEHYDVLLSPVNALPALPHDP